MNEKELAEVREMIANRSKEVLHTYSMIGLLRDKSPVNWDEAYINEATDVLADQILNTPITMGNQNKSIGEIIKEWMELQKKT